MLEVIYSSFSEEIADDFVAVGSTIILLHKENAYSWVFQSAMCKSTIATVVQKLLTLATRMGVLTRLVLAKLPFGRTKLRYEQSLYDTAGSLRMKRPPTRGTQTNLVFQYRLMRKQTEDVRDIPPTR